MCRSPTFGGTFEGQGHTVSGLELSGDASHMGLFRYVQAAGTVRDLKVTGNIDAAGTLNEIGAIVGTNYGTISGCSFSGTISGQNNVGGIAGTNEGSGMIYNCKTEGSVEGDHYVGGIVGQNVGTISYCSNTTGVNVSASEAVDNVEDLDSLTLPTASDDDDDDIPKKANTSTDVGGICGFSSGVIIGCTNWGGVGFEHVGYNIGGIVRPPRAVWSPAARTGAPPPAVRTSAASAARWSRLSRSMSSPARSARWPRSSTRSTA